MTTRAQLLPQLKVLLSDASSPIMEASLSNPEDNSMPDIKRLWLVATKAAPRSGFPTPIHGDNYYTLVSAATPEAAQAECVDHDMLFVSCEAVTPDLIDRVFEGVAIISF